DFLAGRSEVCRRSLRHSHTLARRLLWSFCCRRHFSFRAGLNLWLVKPDAVRFARRYLLTYLIANIAYFVFWTLVVRPTQMLGLTEMGWYHVVGPIASTALWYFYLEHSKRVRDTYRHG